MINRREMLLATATGAAAVCAGRWTLADEKPFVYKIGAWTSNLEQAKALGLDAVQVSFSIRPTEHGDLRDPKVRDNYLQRSADTGVAITSLAMGAFNSLPFWEIEDCVTRVSECIDTMAAMKVKYVLISYFGKGSLNTDEKYAETIKRYKQLAPKAEDAGVVLAIEAPLNAEQHLRIVDAVNSPAVQVYYDPGNMIHFLKTTEAICDDIRKLKGHIVEAHCKDGTLLGKGRIDYAQINRAYKDAGFFGTQVIEGSIDRTLGYEESIRQNAAYMRKVS